MKLFVTVGTQYPFDRLVRTVDEWADGHPQAEIFAQVGPGRYVPRNIRSVRFIDADECVRRAEWADLVIAHAGMGSIITALELSKPIVVMPRRAELGEHRNDHQLGTTRKLLAQGKVIVAFDEAHLREKLNQLQQLTSHQRGCGQASPRLLAAVRDFVVTGRYEGAVSAPATEEFEPAVGLAALQRDELEVAGNQAVHG
jgi:UDP-N-acetylglucosamine transferase subunit ALG13